MEEVEKKRFELYKPGQSGNPAGRPKGIVGGRQRALNEVDRLLSVDENIACLGKALTDALHKKPLWFFVNIIMPLLPKETKGSLESGDRVIEWRGLVTVGPGTPGVTRAPSGDAGDAGFVAVPGAVDVMPPVGALCGPPDALGGPRLAERLDRDAAPFPDPFRAGRDDSAEAGLIGGEKPPF